MFDVMSLVVCENWWTETECPCRFTLFKQQAVLVSVSHFDVSWVRLWSFYSFNISHIHIIDYDQIRLSDPCPTYPLHITFSFQLYVLFKKEAHRVPWVLQKQCVWKLEYPRECGWPLRGHFHEESWLLSQQPSIPNRSSARAGTSGALSSPCVVEWFLFLVENVF